jgi:hypothetical protein
MLAREEKQAKQRRHPVARRRWNRIESHGQQGRQGRKSENTPSLSNLIPPCFYWVTPKIRLNFRPQKYRIFLDQI